MLTANSSRRHEEVAAHTCITQLNSRYTMQYSQRSHYTTQTHAVLSSIHSKPRKCELIGSTHTNLRKHAVSTQLSPHRAMLYSLVQNGNFMHWYNHTVLNAYSTDLHTGITVRSLYVDDMLRSSDGRAPGQAAPGCSHHTTQPLSIRIPPATLLAVSRHYAPDLALFLPLTGSVRDPPIERTHAEKPPVHLSNQIESD